jgi:protein-disulfide isomerase
MAKLAVPVNAQDHIRGNPNAPLTLLEYGDYQCPYCGAAYPVVEQVRQHFGDRLRFVFRHFPLTQVHPAAESAAEAAEAAGAQGKFWEMHDMLFTHQYALDDVHLAEYAAIIGLDVGRFKLDLASHAYAERVREYFLSGVRSGVNGTPTFFINGERHDGSYDLPTLTAALQSALARSGQSVS